MNIVRNWKRVVSCGCLHSEYANQDAVAAVLLFVEQYKPEHRIFLGDCYDTTCLRSGAKGTQDENSPIDNDLKIGREFLYNFRPTVFTEGNHDARPRLLMNHSNTIIAEAAKSIYERMMQPLWDMNTIITPWDIFSFYELGGYKWMHGCLFSEQYLRDTANRFGNSVVAHAHRPGISKGVHIDSPTAYGVGTLMDPTKAKYAANRTSTLGWAPAMVWGEVCEDKANLNLHAWSRDEEEWRLPI